MEKKNIILSISILFFIFYILISLNIDENVLTSPDQNVAYILSQNYIKEGSLTFKLEDYNQLNENISIALNPRDSTQFEGNMVPKEFPIGLIIYGIISVFQITFVPILIIFISLTIYLITKILFNNNTTALLTFVLTLVFSPLWIQNITLISPSLLSFFFFLIGLYFLLVYKFGTKSSKFIFFICFLFLMYSMILRPIMIIFIAPLILLFKIKEFKELLTKKNIIIYILIMIILLFPLLSLNHQLYGAFYKTGHNLASEIEKNTANPASNSLINIDYSRIISNFNIYIISFSFIFLIVLFGIFSYKKYKNERERLFLRYFLITFFISFIYFGSRNVWGLQKFAINSSLIRYLLPLLLLSIPFYAYYTILLSKKSKIGAVLLIMAFLIININLGIYASGGIIENTELTERFSIIQNEILNKTESNSIIISAFYDKFLFPKRTIIVVSILSENKEEINIKERVWSIYPKEKLLANKIYHISRLQKPIYLIKDEPYFSDSDLNKNLIFYNLELKRIESNYRIYTIIPHKNEN